MKLLNFGIKMKLIHNCTRRGGKETGTDNESSNNDKKAS
jgi:hypothetical protein